jgi:hypothetical protein
MKLPEMKHPQYEVQLLSYPNPIKYRPFTVREEMILRMAVEAKDLDSTVNALKQVVENCLVSEIDVDNMAIVDMETLFLHLRARSIGETGSQFFKCKNEVTTTEGQKKECGMLLEVPIKYLEVPVINNNAERNIKFSDDMGVTMKFPSYKVAKELINLEQEEAEVTLVALCIDKIFSSEEVFNADDCTLEELVEFVLKLHTDKYEKMKEFCFNAPKNQLTVQKKCARCEYEHSFTLEGIQDFFG